MKTVSQWRPRFKVRISGRESTELTQQDRQIVALSTEYSVNEPAGKWGLTFNSGRDKRGRTWDQRIRPQDYVEIHVGRYGQDDPPLVMRGFVDNAFQTTAISGNTPQRVVIVNGRNQGKRLLISQVYFLQLIDQLQTIIGADALSINAAFRGALNNANMKPQEFLDVVDKYLLNAADFKAQFGVGGLTTVAGAAELKLKADPSLDGMVVSQAALAQHEGPTWNFLEHYQGKPILEYVMREDKSESTLLWRWAPYKGRDGKLLEPATDPGTTTISAAEIENISVGTSDNQVFAYYRVIPQISQAWGASAQTLMAGVGFGNGTQGQQGGSTTVGARGQNPVFRKELADRYGFRPMDVPFPLLPIIDNPRFTDEQRMQGDWRPLLEKLAAWLDDAFSHNAALEGGQMTLRGDERIVPGTYVKIRETSQEFYVNQVHHEYKLGNNDVSFKTTLQVTRGLWTKNNPYPDEVSGEGGIQINPPSGTGGGDSVDIVNVESQDITSTDLSATGGAA